MGMFFFSIRSDHRSRDDRDLIPILYIGTDCYPDIIGMQVPCPIADAVMQEGNSIEAKWKSLSPLKMSYSIPISNI